MITVGVLVATVVAIAIRQAVYGFQTLYNPLPGPARVETLQS